MAIYKVLRYLISLIWFEVNNPILFFQDRPWKVRFILEFKIVMKQQHQDLFELQKSLKYPLFFLILLTVKSNHFLKHKDFNATSLVNDIALIKLAQPVRFSNTIKPVCLSDVDLARPNTKAWLTGWVCNLKILFRIF